MSVAYRRTSSRVRPPLSYNSLLSYVLDRQVEVLRKYAGEHLQFSVLQFSVELCQACGPLSTFLQVFPTYNSLLSYVKEYRQRTPTEEEVDLQFSVELCLTGQPRSTGDRAITMLTYNSLLSYVSWAASFQQASLLFCLHLQFSVELCGRRREPDLSPTGLYLQFSVELCKIFMKKQSWDCVSYNSLLSYVCAN